MKSLVVGLVVLSLSSPLLAAEPVGYQAGVAKRVITPKEWMWMAGYAGRDKPAEGKVHELHAKAICLQDAAGTKLVLVTTDLIGISRGLGDAVAAEVEKTHGIKRHQLIINASHTHCGPVIIDNLIDMYPLTKEEAAKVEKYTDQLKDALVEVIADSIKKLQPVSLKYGAGKATFAVNRREPTDKGVIIGRNPAGPVDHSVPVLVVESVEGTEKTPVAVIFGYACHNTTLSFYQWCGDYAGFAQVAIEKELPGTTAMFWIGCGGDANPSPRGKLEQAEEYGKELAQAAVGAIKSAKPVSGKFAGAYDKVTLEFAELPTREQLNADLLSKNLALKKRAERLLKELDANGKLTNTYSHYPVQTWVIGDQVLLVALGGEVVIDYQIRLKKEIPTSRALWVMGYSNDVMAYIPSERVLKEGGYEADSSQVYYGMPGKWSSKIENDIIEKVKQQVRTIAPLPKAPGPLTPKEEKDTFRIDDRFTIDLVASEPAIVDPVAMCFDAKGRMFVCEMRGYPNNGVGTGKETRGKIKCLIDGNGDGEFETVTTFADGLRFPMGITPYKSGVIVAVAPDIVFLEDTNNDGKADTCTVLYTGFNTANIQQMVNSLQWGLDNWIYGIAGSDAGTITSPQIPKFAPLRLGNRGFRFKPDIPGSLEPTSSGGQYGLTADDYQRWFTATNNQHLRQIVLPDHYLKRNPHLAVSAVTLDIPEHGAAAKVFRISEFEPWRVERTTRRAGSADSQRFPTTELVPGGYITSACSPLIYTADLFAKEYYGNNFVCDPANNLIHRELLEGNGAVFKAVRAYQDREFLASTDTWFRPVHLSIGPDGAIYILDFYREVIETPLSLPDDIKQQLNLESRGRGRIWRVAPKDFKTIRMPDLTELKTRQLAELLLSGNSWTRLSVQRLLLEKQEADSGQLIREHCQTAKNAPALANIAWTLHGLGALRHDTVVLMLGDAQPGNREQGIRLAEAFLADSPDVCKQLQSIVDDRSPRVRFQLALTAGAMNKEHAVQVLAALLEKDAADPWIVTAALSSASECGAAVLESLTTEGKKPNPQIVTRLAAMIGAKGNVKEIVQVLNLAASDRGADLDQAILAGLGQGMRNTKKQLTHWWNDPPADAVAVMKNLRKRYQVATTIARDESEEVQARIRSVNLLAYGPFDFAAGLAELLIPTTPGDLQLAVVRTLGAHSAPDAAELLLKHWTSYAPAVRREAMEAMLSRTDRVKQLLRAMDAKTVSVTDFTAAQIQQLRDHPDREVRATVERQFKRSDPDRALVVKEYMASLDLLGDAEKGRVVFKRTCAACHKLDGVGFDVGANLLAALPSKSGEELLIAIFDPNREVDPRYRSFNIVTADERVLTGVIASESPTSITLRRADAKEDVILRADISTLRSTSISLMPVGLEKELTKQEAADLLAYLRKPR